MSDLTLLIRIDREMKTDAPELERLEEQIEKAKVGEVGATLSGLEETVLFVELPAHCLETDLPDRIARLEKVVAASEFAGQAKVEIAKDADDSWDDEGEDL
jgi:hypothetical protein